MMQSSSEQTKRALGASAYCYAFLRNAYALFAVDEG